MARILVATIALFALFAQAALATGFLSVESSPNGAEVWYTGPDDPDRKYLGDTPLENREMPTGRYNLWLILPTHDTLAVPEISIAEGQHTLVNREIPTHYGNLEVQTLPDSAEIWLDGVKVGFSPYENNLMLAGDRRLKIDPRDAIFRNTALKLPINKGDTIRMTLTSPYRNKSFLNENLSLTPWRLGLEFGLQHRTATGFYDTTKRDPFSNAEKRTQLDFPIAARLGLPQGFEVHLLLPFKSFNKGDTAVFPSNMQAGVKYTYRPYNVGLDVTWGQGFKDGKDAFTHDYLSLTLLGMHSKGNIVADAQAGFQFHFSDKDSSILNYGDEAHLHARIGYLLDPFMPYLGVTGILRLNGTNDGESEENGGHLIIPEPGFTVEIDDLFSVQMGIPFTVFGKRNLSYWGMHGSLSLTIDIL